MLNRHRQYRFDFAMKKKVLAITTYITIHDMAWDVSQIRRCGVALVNPKDSLVTPHAL